MMNNIQEILLMDQIADLSYRIEIFYDLTKPLPPDVDNLIRLCTAYLHCDTKAVRVYLGRHFWHRAFSN